MQTRPQVRLTQSPSQETQSAPKSSLHIVYRNKNEQNDPSDQGEYTALVAVIAVLIMLSATLLWYMNYYDVQRYNSDTLAGTIAETDAVSQNTAPEAGRDTGADRSTGTNAPAYTGVAQ